MTHLNAPFHKLMWAQLNLLQVKNIQKSVTEMEK